MPGDDLAQAEQDYAAYSVPRTEVVRWRTELTDELCAVLINAARSGGFKKQIALACGVPPKLFHWWLSEGMRGDAPALFQRLSVGVERAINRRALQWADTLGKAAEEGDWTAAASLLKLRDPLWSGKEEEPSTSEPETSLQGRYEQLVESLRRPTAELLKAMVEAGLSPPISSPVSDEPPEPSVEGKEPDDAR